MNTYIKPEYVAGAKCLFFSYIPLFLILLIVELFVSPPSRNWNNNLVKTVENFSTDTLVYYLSSGGLHIILCSLSIIYLGKQIWPKTKEFKKQLLLILLVLITINTTPVILTTALFNPSLAWFSHERLYMIMKNSIYYKSYFNQSSQFFYMFSLFPITLTICALIQQVFSCMSLGKIVSDFKRNQYSSQDREKFKQDSSRSLKKIRETIHITSVIMITSTICTILFLLLPVDCINEVLLQKKFLKTSISIGVCWGIIYSLTLLFIGIWSFSNWSKVIQKILGGREFASDEDINKWRIEQSDLFSLTSNVKFTMDMLSPIIVSITGAFISNAF